MAGFTFRLSVLLRARRSQRDQCRAALADAQRVEAEIAEQLDGLDREFAALREFCREKAATGAVDVARLIEAQRYGLLARARRQRAVRERQAAAAESERRRAALIEADREVRILENLRQRQAEEHRREEEARETRRLDEVGAEQYSRNGAPW